MKKVFYILLFGIILGILLGYLFKIEGVHAQVSPNFWLLNGTNLKPIGGSWGLQLPSTPCTGTQFYQSSGSGVFQCGTPIWTNPGYLANASITANLPITWSVGNVIGFTNPGYVTSASSVTWSALQTFNAGASSSFITSPSGTIGVFYANQIYDSGATSTECETADPITGLFSAGNCVISINNLHGFVIATGTANQILVSSSTGQLVWSISPNYGPTTTIPTIFVTSLGGQSGILTVNASSGVLFTMNGAGVLSAQNIGVTSITGTAGQITRDVATGSVTLSIPNPLIQNVSSTALTFTNATSSGNLQAQTLTILGQTTLASASSSNFQATGTFLGQGVATFSSNVNISGTANASTSITINGQAVSTSTGANPTATIGKTVTNGSANTFLRSDGAPALATQYASTTLGPATIWDATTTAQYAYFLLSATDFSFTINEISCQNVAATTTYRYIRATSSINTTGQSIGSSTCGTTLNTVPAAFLATSTIDTGTFIVAITSSTVGTPTRDEIWIHATK